jgi:hypothetical protein
MSSARLRPNKTACPQPKNFEGFPYASILASPQLELAGKLPKRVVSVEDALINKNRDSSVRPIPLVGFDSMPQGVSGSRLELSLNGPKCIPRQVGKH